MSLASGPLLNPASGPLLNKGEPAAYEIVNPGGRSELVLVCDHASRRVPENLHNLGLTDAQLNSHIGWDPGAALLARDLSIRLDAPLVLSNYSRLVIDCNRHPANASSIPVISDDTEIPGNLGLNEAAMQARRSVLFDPYHAAIGDLLDARSERRNRLLSIHSFTPVLASEERPWSIGVCYGSDKTWAMQWLSALRSRQAEAVGDNQPYSVEEDLDYTLPVHCGRREISGLMLELRQDKLVSGTAIQRWSELIAQCWLSIV